MMLLFPKEKKVVTRKMKTANTILYCNTPVKLETFQNKLKSYTKTLTIAMYPNGNVRLGVTLLRNGT